MRIGWIGLGKLGLPIAAEIAKTHTVYGNETFCGDDLEPIKPDSSPLMLAGKTALLDCDLIFVAVQTPHGPKYEGVTRLPETRADFDYRYLTEAVRSLASAGEKRPPLVIISTVLPGTIEREILPLWDGPVIFNPFFIAMGSEVADFLDPEFVLLGVDHRVPTELIELYRSLGVEAPALITGYREAELAKMAYNTFIGLKIAYANTIGELCARLGIDATAVLNIVRAGKKRITSPAYMSAGMGDGGPCHPRDNIALSWLARETGMSFDLFDAVMRQRENHAEWQADLILDASFRVPLDDPDGFEQYLPVTVLGRAYKDGTEIETGSPGLLIAELLRERGVEFEHASDLP